ncbi:MAG: hypothetical protein IJZ36_04240, partial [Bacilli bacterium]|nr:hypothetical protein [Bacilli bacterium]
FMDGFIDADKIDYLERDSINCCVGYGKFDRNALIRNLTIVIDKNGHEVLGIQHEGIQALESFILARYYMFSQVYMHPKERIYRYMFVEEMTSILSDGKYPEDIRKFLALDDTRFARKFKFLTNLKYDLIYDSEYDQVIQNKVDRKLGQFLLSDTPRKSIFRKDTDDDTILVLNTFTGKVQPCTELSPILKGIEYANVHKLRYYAPKDRSSQIKAELYKLVKGV